MNEFEALTKAIDGLSSTSTVALKYGPFFFALLLLLFSPLLVGVLYKKFIGEISDRNNRNDFVKEYSFYLRMCVLVGVVCVLASSGWWMYSESANTRQLSERAESAKTEMEKLKVEKAKTSFAITGTIDNDAKKAAKFQDLVDGDVKVYFRKKMISSSHFVWDFVAVWNSALPYQSEGYGWIKAASEADPPKLVKIIFSNQPWLGSYVFTQDDSGKELQIKPKK